MVRQAVPSFSDELDVLGVGIGPFNLGLAALLERVPETKALFLERKPQFDWHPGMLIEGTTLQVPFFADLVTMADPTHPLSYLNYLHEHGRLYHFYFLEKFQIPRREYNHYCKWAAERLATCRFGYEVSDIQLEEGQSGSRFVVEAVEQHTEQTVRYAARNLVLGVGSRPHIPARFQTLRGPNVFHSSDYLSNRERCLRARSITVVGSGQSAAEVALDLLRAQGENGYRLDWFTRSSGFFPMEYSKLGLEHFSPDYTQYFYGLDPERKDKIRAGQGLLYKGISANTIADIYDTLYEAGIGGKEGPGVRLLSLTEVEQIIPSSDRGGYRLHCRQLQQEVSFEHSSDIVILATGYEHAEPACLSGLEPLICRDAKGRFDIAEQYSLKLRNGGENRIFIQNGELHTHGVGAPDLGLGAHRNSVIIKQLAGREVYPLRERNVFQQFGISE
ncbi:lysine N(6)-hydroxylase/L-ornithine N(5)-oxygenase family protein [Paenibacillus pasadenensis]|uniref:lysine N(6)-hydroxylase/L-ornithine N(5)-oxygenase family protein n=1 Tax=Paenibacillus pasadenensis TaxID=217090 RepID=UPI00203DE4E2|nr:lysine N(6)-hydroxylase/L-ornithine N(5)-oxygenase family protein [Paenibacillus pasadenensis]MCM3747842.1 lysine N(6)-hydroxylase/L-ornithine N(5)-oxygenase family protein [Paenibacillus pasadenensis]